MIRTKVTRLELERVDVSCEYIERASELEHFIHLSFNRFKAVTGVGGKTDIGLFQHKHLGSISWRLLVPLKQKQMAFQ